MFYKLTVLFSGAYHYLLERYHGYFFLFPSTKLIHVRIFYSLLVAGHLKVARLLSGLGDVCVWRVGTGQDTLYLKGREPSSWQ